MKLFDPLTELAKIENQGHPPASSASSASFSIRTPQKEANEAKEAAPQRQNPKFSAPANPTDMRHGKSVAGNPLTWTGKVVSLEDWRDLTEWEKHGPNGRHWNGINRKWEMPS